jgi:hypothetical protein
LAVVPGRGSGTTGEAAVREGMRAILIEREAEYQEDIRRRMRSMNCSALAAGDRLSFGAATAQPDARRLRCTQLRTGEASRIAALELLTRLIARTLSPGLDEGGKR